MFDITLTTPEAILLYSIFNAAVQALPEPEPTNHKVYRFIYAFFNLLAMNVADVKDTFVKRRDALRQQQSGQNN